MILKLKRRICWSMAMLLLSLHVIAQQGVPEPIKGIVVDAEQGDALPGVMVRIKTDTKITTITDKDGRFVIRAREGDVLLFSYLGYAPLEMAVANIKKNPTIRMTAVDTKLNEVVIVGYGEVNRKEITGSIGEVNMDNLLKAPVASFDQALAGRIAGVQVTSPEEQPGAGMNIVIRGGNSLTQSNSPLYVVDDFPIEDPLNAAINPNDIESITILKDASATAIYGSRGANGVVIIKTKQGKIGKAVVKYDGSAGFQEVTKMMDLMSPYEFVKYQLELRPANATVYLDRPSFTLEDYKHVPTIDWQNMLFRQAFMQTHNLALSGGTQQTKYAFSGSIYNQNGIIINSGYKRYQGRVSVDQTINKQIKVGLKVNYTRDFNYGQLASLQQGSSISFSTYPLYRVWGYRPVTGGGDLDILDDLLDEEDDLEINDYRINPITSTNNEIRQASRSIFTGNAYISYDITKALTLKITGGFNSRVDKDENFYNSKTGRGYPSVNNTRGVNGLFGYDERNDWVNANTLTYKKKFNRNHSFEALGGFTVQGLNRSTYGYQAYNIPNEDLGLSGMDQGQPGALDALLTENIMVSYLGRVNYGYKSKYLLTATFRADGSSKFTPKNRWGYFPSAAFAWRIDKEKFMRKLAFVSDAKLRLSYGVTGNNRIGDYVRYSSLDLPYSNYYSFNNADPSPSIVVNRFGNNDLKWESTGQVDIGFDLGLFKNRIKLEIDAYRKNTFDLLLNANVPSTSGFSKIYKNVGEIRNDGLEFTLSTENIKSKRFSWSSDFNISFNRNKIVALSDGEDNILSTITWLSDYNSTPLYAAKVGGSASDFYGVIWDGVYQYSDFDRLPSGAYRLKNSVATNGADAAQIQPGDVKYRDVNNDGVVNDKDIVKIGRGLPIHTGGFSNNFTYNRFNLNVFFQWSYGNNIFNANRIVFEGNDQLRYNLNQYATYNDRWSADNQDSKNFRTGGQGIPGLYSSRTIEDGSYLRLKTISLSYDLPVALMKRMKIQNVSIYASAQNLYTWTNYSGMDPEVSTRNTTLTPGFDYSAYPRPRTFTFGMRLTL